MSTDIGGGEDGQTGDISHGDTAGRDIYQGANADLLIDLVRRQIDKDSQYRMLDLNAREMRQNMLDKQIDDILSELRLQRILLIVGLMAIIIIIALAL